MIFPDVPLKEWLEKTGLEAGSSRCSKCKEVFEYAVPFITKDYYGVRTPVHGCGEGFVSAAYTPRSKEKMDLWKEILGGL